MKETILGHLALRFNVHPENLATEALGFLLRRSQPGRAGFAMLLKNLGVGAATADLHYQNQGADNESGIPDIVGFDNSSAEVVIVEAKFWAGLTEKQPIEYLKRFGAAGGVLLVVAPAVRLPLLWSELERRCREATLSFTVSNGLPSGCQAADVGQNRLLALTSWQAVLASLAAEMEKQGDTAGLADVVQLRGLCDRVDEAAFLPVRPEELTSRVYNRVLDLAQLVDPIADALEKQKIATRPGRLTHGLGWTSQKLIFHGLQAALLFDVWAWTHLAATPLWLKIFGDGKNSSAAEAALVAMTTEKPPRLFKSGDGYPLVALSVPTGVERDAVIAAIVEDCRMIAGLLSKAAVAPSSQASGPSPSASSYPPAGGPG